jgi:N-acetylglutamate synthase-like GNAT family acetyltransferase
MYTVINDESLIKKGFKISTNKDLLDIKTIHDYLSNASYWSKGISEEKVQRSIDNSMCFGVYKDDKQIGLARVVTDKAIFAYVCDVFILDEYRGNGLSKWLLQTILAHPHLQGLKRWSLATLDAHGLYSQFGFSPLSKPENWMEIYSPIKKD